MAEANPTKKNYDLWVLAYDHLNAGLFGGQLPGCVITFQRQRNLYGFHAHGRFQDTEGALKADEIALNPSHFAELGEREAVSVLAHEMAHQYQWHFGAPGQVGYHNKDWARLMIEIGLVPSDTGRPGGKATGRRVGHFIREDGPFDRVCTELLRGGFVVPYVETESAQHTAGENGSDDPQLREAAERQRRKAEILRRKKAASKTPFICPGCELPQRLWGKSSLNVICGECGERFVASCDDHSWPDESSSPD